MNQDLISRQAILKHIEKKRQDALMIDDLRESNIIMMGMKLLEEAVRIQPSAQPERKKGKWIRHDEIKNVYGGICIECSECGEKYVVQHILDEKYCRNCGAKMEVGENAD